MAPAARVTTTTTSWAASGRADSIRAVLDPAHWATALRYTERNAAWARMVARAEDWEWSSARAHLGLAPTPAWLDTRELAQNRLSPEDWRESLGTQSGETDRREAAALRLASRHDTAFGSPEFVEEMERKYGVQLHAKPLGRPRKPPQAEAALTAAAAVSA